MAALPAGAGKDIVVVRMPDGGSVAFDRVHLHGIAAVERRLVLDEFLVAALALVAAAGAPISRLRSGICASPRSDGAVGAW